MLDFKMKILRSLTWDGDAFFVGGMVGGAIFAYAIIGFILRCILAGWPSLRVTMDSYIPEIEEC